MITHTNSYKILKSEMQEIFDFVVAVCYSIPSLKMNIKSVKEGKIPHMLKADYFSKDVSTPEQIRKRTINYKKKMARYILITSFSFFEAYFKNALQEIVDFHGGKDEIIKLANNRIKKNFENQDSKIISSKRKLQDSFKSKNIEKYKKHTNLLLQHRFIFPTDLFTTYGLKKTIELPSTLRAKDIPSIISDVLHIELLEDEIRTFHGIREFRNKIAHGIKVEISLRKVIEINDFLRKLALKVDKQIVDHYLVIEKFVLI